MFELKSNPDYLHHLAADTREAGLEETAKDIDNAAHDIKNLRDYMERLERSVSQLSREINSIRTQRDEAAAALLTIFRPELETMVRDICDYDRQIDALCERVEQLEQDMSENIAEQIRDGARESISDLISDGEIIVTIETNF